jgi:hypothetical protein
VGGGRCRMSATCWPERKLRAFDSRENVYRTESQVGGYGYSMMKAASINPPSPIAMISIVVLSNFSNPSVRIDVAARHLVMLSGGQPGTFIPRCSPIPPSSVLIS